MWLKIAKAGAGLLDSEVNAKLLAAISYQSRENRSALVALE